MLETLAAVIASRPAAVLGHVQAYADLARLEASLAAKALLRRAAWALAGLALAALALVFAGVAGMLVLFQPDPLEPTQHWVWAPPAAALIVAAIAFWRVAALSRALASTLHFEATRRQLAADLQMVQGWSGKAVPEAPSGADATGPAEPDPQRPPGETDSPAEGVAQRKGPLP